MEDDKIQWHRAFFEALKLELCEYENYLEFINEFQLSKEALRIDVLVIKKEAGVKIKKNIGQIFRQHNIFEFKSETDNLSVNDFYKVYAYALLYKTFNDIALDDISLNFTVTRHPRLVLKHLQEERGYKISEVYDGIYYAEGDVFPIQIIESKKLSAADNLWLKNLRSNLQAKELTETLATYRHIGRKDFDNSYIATLMKANIKQIKEETKMTTEEMWDTVADVMNRQGVLDRFKKETAEQVTEQVTKQVTEQVTEQVAGNTIKDVIRKLKQSAIATNEQIANSLNLPLSEVEQA